MENDSGFIHLVDKAVEDFRQWQRVFSLASEAAKKGEAESLSLHKEASKLHAKSDESREAVLAAAEGLPAILEQAGEDSRGLLVFIKLFRGREGLADLRLIETWETLRPDLSRFAVRQCFAEAMPAIYQQMYDRLCEKLFPSKPGVTNSLRESHITALVFEHTELAPSEFQRLSVPDRIVWLDQAYQKIRPDDPAGGPKRKKKKRKRGGQKVYDTSDDKKVAEAWKTAKNNGTYKAEFAREKGLSVKELDRLLNRVRARKAKAKS